ncbi:MAG: ankyrin repeat domain-containing protein [Tatlockia sp.]|jgi:ankyrin repeat protein
MQFWLDVQTLLWAAFNNNAHLVKSIVSRTQDVDIINAKDRTGDTPLLTAVKQHWPEIVIAMLNRDMPEETLITLLNTPDREGNTALLNAVGGGLPIDRVIIKTILSKNSTADVMNAAWRGQTALMVAT